MLLWILKNKFSCSHIFIFPGDVTRSRVAGSNNNSISVPWRTSGLFSKIIHHVSFPPAANEFPILPQPHQQFSSLWLTAILAKYEAIFTVDFSIPLMTKDTQHLFMCLGTIYISFFWEKCLFISSAHLSVGLFVILLWS